MTTTVKTGVIKYMLGPKHLEENPTDKENCWKIDLQTKPVLSTNQYSPTCTTHSTKLNFGYF